MTTKHTAGPWKLRDSNPNDMHIRAGEKGFVIAEVNSRTANFIGNKEEAEANAQLIAAAPELLAALIHVSERIGTVRPNDAFCQALKQIADEAIKTAVKQ